MIRNKEKTIYSTEPWSEDCWKNLAGAMMTQAMEDLASPDPVLALDAMEWFDDDGEIYEQVTGAEANTLQRAVAKYNEFQPIRFLIEFLGWFDGGVCLVPGCGKTASRESGGRAGYCQTHYLKIIKP